MKIHQSNYYYKNKNPFIKNIYLIKQILFLRQSMIKLDHLRIPTNVFYFCLFKLNFPL